MSNTKIVVVRLKELVLTAAFVLAGIAMLVLFLLLSSLKGGSTQVSDTPASALYYPGVYTSSMTLNDTTIHLELVCDKNHIRSVRLIHLDEAVETMYPLLSPALSDLELQLANDIPLQELTLTEGSRYTQTLLLEVIEQTLNKAEIKD